MQFIDLGAQRARIEDKLNAAIAKVIAEGRYILGPEVAEFEKQIVSYLGVKHAIACANGTDALLMPLMAFGIGAGDAVFCPSFTFAATAEVVALVGAEPVFIDVLPDSYTMDPIQLKQAIAMIRKAGYLEPKAVIPVDLFGLSACYNAISAIATEEKLFVIEDAAQSIGGKRDNIMCGAFGNVGATSFYPAKPLGCYGDGGAMFTDDDKLAAVLRSVLFHGKGETQYDNVRTGLNSRLDTIQAAILIEKLAILEDEMEKRSHIAARYDKGLKDVVKVPTIPSGCRSAYAQYTIEAENRDELQAHLWEAHIPSVIYYAKPLHLQTAYCRFPCADGGLLVSEKLARRVLSLPMHPYLSYDDQNKVISSIRSFYKA
ncbi:MAG: aminotransferase [Candidatus Tokpelaia sp. JSC189]|nr:MAG: aminotransferase [Candidatus Tokpelaia sp. JSC189]